jgi:hypothetical protein
LYFRMRKSVMVMVMVVEHISNSLNVDPPLRSIDLGSC